MKSFPFGKVPDANQLAELFYNLALEDVKKQVETQLEVLRMLYNQESDSAYLGAEEICERIIEIIDDLKQ